MASSESEDELSDDDAPAKEASGAIKPASSESSSQLDVERYEVPWLARLLQDRFTEYPIMVR